MKANKNLYTLFQRIKRTHYYCIKGFDAYAKVVESYGGRTPTYPGLVKSNIANMGVQYNNNSTSE